MRIAFAALGALVGVSLCTSRATAEGAAPAVVTSFAPLFDANLNGTEITLSVWSLPGSGVGTILCDGKPRSGYCMGLRTITPTAAGVLAWANGAELDNVAGLFQHHNKPMWDCSATTALGPNTPIVEVPGLFNNAGYGTVQGTVTYMTDLGPSSCGAPLVIAIQTQNDAGLWNDAQTSGAPEGSAVIRVATVSAQIDANTPVRVQLRTAPDLCGQTVTVYIKGAQLFGQQCFPDAANPGQCL